MAELGGATTPERTFEPSQARRIWRIAQPLLWLAACVAAAAADQPVPVVVFGIAALIVGTAAWWQRCESLSIEDDALRRTTGKRTTSVDLRQLSRIRYELMRGKFPIPPRSLWLTENGTEVYLGHRGSWIRGQWDDLLRELAPWAAGVDRNQAALRLFNGVTGCLAGLPDGRPGFVPEDLRHADCPHPELCDPTIARTRQATRRRII